MGRISVSQADIVAALAALDAAGMGVRPGPDWKTTTEWAELKGIARGTAQARLTKLVKIGTWERRQSGRTNYYRPKP